MEEKLKVGDRVRVPPHWLMVDGGDHVEDDDRTGVVIAKTGETVTIRHDKSGRGSLCSDWNTSPERLPSPSPEAPRTEGRWPPQKGDVYFAKCFEGRNVTFDGSTYMHQSLGRLWNAHDGGQFRDEAFTNGTLTFVSHATPDKPEPVRDLRCGYPIGSDKDPCRLNPGHAGRHSLNRCEPVAPPAKPAPHFNAAYLTALAKLEAEEGVTAKPGCRNGDACTVCRPRKPEAFVPSVDFADLLPDAS